MSTTTTTVLPLPDHFARLLADPAGIAAVRRVPYADIAAAGRDWAARHGLPKAATDKTRVALLPIDNQLTFCSPDFELFVAGRSGQGAVDDTRRLCEFIYRNLHVLTAIYPTMDTHTTM